MSVFADVIGHRMVTSLLEGEAAKPSQAYLFVGPSSVGKATVARRFAALVLAGEDPGGRQRVIAGIHPDLHLVEPDGRTSLTVDQARATVARASLSPVEGDRKVFLFEEAGMMNDEAANALLKTLEEPSETTVFILVTDSEDDLPATVASRCRTVFFGRVTEEEVVASLTDAGIEVDQAKRCATTSGGRPGLAKLLATRPEVAAFRAAWLSVPQRLSDQPGDAFRLADELVAATRPLVEGIEVRHAAELADADEDGGSTKALKERHERERRRADRSLHVTGLEILASWYRDAAAAQFGAPVRNKDVSGTALAGVRPALAVERAGRTLATIESLEANQRPDLAFAALFSDLAAAR